MYLASHFISITGKKKGCSNNLKSEIQSHVRAGVRV